MGKQYTPEGFIKWKIQTKQMDSTYDLIMYEDCLKCLSEYSTELLQENERLKEHLKNFSFIVENMHKPEYATFFVGDDQVDGYELAERIKATIK